MSSGSSVCLRFLEGLTVLTVGAETGVISAVSRAGV